ncbi:hypothetical protein B0T10DRAFT_134459 [Thelonectria olida]|uniref:Uncharacterized protein n=1 Tax=Thelonectria olida TaxID=1576542 RepID=A0A9P9AP52_9HYPO|nr:hypothetical protein B0T10DRAFT_134459 [Thelonectria olida]
MSGAGWVSCRCATAVLGFLDKQVEQVQDKKRRALSKNRVHNPKTKRGDEANGRMGGGQVLRDLGASSRRALDASTWIGVKPRCDSRGGAERPSQRPLRCRREGRVPVDAKGHEPITMSKQVTDAACGGVASNLCHLVGGTQGQVKRRHHAQEGCVGGARPMGSAPKKVGDVIPASGARIAGKAGTGGEGENRPTLRRIR